MLADSVLSSCLSYPYISFATETSEGLPRPAFLMSWRRRIGKEDESLFFTGCKNAGLEVRHMGSRVFCITPRDATARNATEKLTCEVST